MSRFPSLLSIVVPVGLAAALVSGCFGPSEVKVTLLVTGALQGNITPFMAEDGKERHKVGGVAFLAARLRALRAEAEAGGATVFVCDVGDDLPGTPDAFYTQGKAVVDTLNPLGLDLMVLGNREFDYGRALLEKRQSEMKFPLVAANVLEGSRAPSFLTTHKIVKAGPLTLLLTGMAPPTTPTETSANLIRGLTFEDEPATVTRIGAWLRESAADFAIVLTQRDLAKQRKELVRLAKLENSLAVGLDFFHQYETLLEHPAFHIAPFHGLSKGTELTRVDLVFDAGTKRLVSGTVSRHKVGPKEGEPDNEIAQIVAEIARRLEPIKNRRIAYTATPLARAYDEETKLGNLVTDAMRASGTADVALQNSGSLRETIVAGPITVGALYNALPFDNEIVTVTLSGADLLEILETSAREKRSILQISGARYTYRGSVPEGQNRLVEVLVGGKTVEPARDYRIATNSYLASGQSGYKTFARARAAAFGPRFRDALESYLERMGTVEIGIEKRIVKIP